MNFRCLTVCQPYATLIALPDDDDRAKRVENRSWGTDYLGLLAIHAGKSRAYLDDGDLEKFPGMPFGAIVAIARLAGCFSMEDPGWAYRRWLWLETHEHVEGPICWVLREVRALYRPVVCKGQRGLWLPSETLRAEVEAALKG